MRQLHLEGADCDWNRKFLTFLIFKLTQKKNSFQYLTKRKKKKTDKNDVNSMHTKMYVEFIFNFKMSIEHCVLQLHFSKKNRYYWTNKP